MIWLEYLFDSFIKKWFNKESQPKYLTGKGKND